MAKYYNEYQPLSPKKGYITILTVILIIVLAATACTVAFVIVPAIREAAQNRTGAPSNSDGSNEQPLPEARKLAAPENIKLDETQTVLSWYCSDYLNCRAYLIKINDTEVKVNSNPATVNLQEGVQSVIQVKAVGDNKYFTDSDWSAPIVVYKQEAEQIAYNLVISSMKSILENEVQVLVSGVNQPITVLNIYTIDCGNSTATVWYTYRLRSSSGTSPHGLAVSTVSMNKVSSLIEYKSKLTIIRQTIENNNITTENLTYAFTDNTVGFLAREDLTGRLLEYKQLSTLTPVCSQISFDSLSGGKARLTLRGIVRREKQGKVYFYTYKYTASCDEIASYTPQNYIDLLSDAQASFTFIDNGSAEITGLGKEMLLRFGG